MKKILLLSLALLLSSCNNNEQLEEQACNMVTELIHDSWDDFAKSNKKFRDYIKKKKYQPAKCVAVKLGEPLRKNYYHYAIAYLDNRAEWEITVELKNDSITVISVEDPLWNYRYFEK